MRALPPLALIACGVLGVTDAPADDHGQTLAHCAATVPASTRPGLLNLRVSCPGLEQLIDDSGFAAQLDDRWKATLDRNGLMDLAWLAQRYQATPASPGPNVASLPSAVQSLKATANPRHGWWQTLRDRLRELLRPREQSGSSWLSRLWQNVTIPRLLQRVLFYAACALIVGMMMWIVWREIKAAGLGAQDARQHAWLGVRDPGNIMAGAVSIADLDSTPARNRPALMLRLLVLALARSGRLKGDRSLTHSELARRGTFDNSDQRQRFVRVARLAEKLLYGPATVEAAATAQSEIDQAVTDGRRLHEQLSAAASAGP